MRTPAQEVKRSRAPRARQVCFIFGKQFTGESSQLPCWGAGKQKGAERARAADAPARECPADVASLAQRVGLFPARRAAAQNPTLEAVGRQPELRGSVVERNLCIGRRQT